MKLKVRFWGNRILGRCFDGRELESRGRSKSAKPLIQKEIKLPRYKCGETKKPHNSRKNELRRLPAARLGGFRG